METGMWLEKWGDKKNVTDVTTEENVCAGSQIKRSTETEIYTWTGENMTLNMLGEMKRRTIWHVSG